MTIAKHMTAKQCQQRASKWRQEGVALECSAEGHWTRGIAGALLVAGLSVVVMTGFADEAWGQEALGDDSYHRVFTTYRAASVIDGHSLRGVQGAINVNMAAGNSNLQSNSGVIAMGENALANNIVVQVVTSNNRLAPDQATAVIKDQALSQSVGWISVNQAAGQENVQSNTLSVALGIRGSTLNSESLSQVLSRTQESTEESDDGTSSRRVAIEDSAFAGSRGVIQVNQSAGKGNATGNHVGVRMTSGARR
ncbi:MAG: hypothetical protein ACQEUG_05535 [Pseudomonadota bacterium]